MHGIVGTQQHYLVLFARANHQKIMAKEGSCVWLATTPGKRWTEVFFLYWSVVWISAMAYIVASSAYESFEENEYMAVGLAFAVPCFVGPLLLPGGQGEPTTPILQRFWVKANLWIWILSFIGNVRQRLLAPCLASPPRAARHALVH